MSAPHYMPIYWSDYQGGTTALDCEQHGAYLLLLGKMWQAGGTLPADDVILARLVGLTKSRWMKISPPVMALFTSVDGGITQKRLAAELKILEEKYESRARAGSLGGRAKSLKDKKATVSNASSNATVLLCQLELEPELEPEREGSEDKSSDADSRVVILDHDAEAWRQAVRLLTAQGRMTEAKARPFFGRLISSNKLEPRDLLPSLAKATVSGTQDPQGYLAKAAEAVSRRRVESGKPRRVGWV